MLCIKNFFKKKKKKKKGNLSLLFLLLKSLGKKVSTYFIFFLNLQF